MAAKHAKLVAEMAKATGVSEHDVTRVLDQLGLSRIYDEAHRSNQGRDLSLKSAKVAFRIGKSTVVV